MLQTISLYYILIVFGVKAFFHAGASAFGTRGKVTFSIKGGWQNALAATLDVFSIIALLKVLGII